MPGGDSSQKNPKPKSLGNSRRLALAEGVRGLECGCGWEPLGLRKVKSNGFEVWDLGHIQGPSLSISLRGL